MYYLHHYFNPDFNYRQLAPLETGAGKVEYRYLGYVQNVVVGQILAEVFDLDAFPAEKRDPRFIYSTPHLPCGPNCGLHPEHPHKLVALANGYVFYHDGLISVKKLLNVRGNLGTATGNIFFVGDVAVHGDLQTGFALQANNILVKGHIETAKVKACRDIVGLSGVKGATLVTNDSTSNDDDEDEKEVIPSGLLDAGGSVRLPFCERMQIRARGNVIIDGACLHSTIYVGGNLVVKGRLQGGTVYANKVVYVEEQLGSEYGTSTRIMMGYDPFVFLQLQKLETRIQYLTAKVAYFKDKIMRNDVMALEHTPRYDLAVYKLKIAQKQHTLLWSQLTLDEKASAACKVIVPGKVMPRCEIAIGPSFFRINEPDQKKIYFLSGSDITATTIESSLSHHL